MYEKVHKYSKLKWHPLHFSYIIILYKYIYIHKIHIGRQGIHNTFWKYLIKLFVEKHISSKPYSGVQYYTESNGKHS